MGYELNPEAVTAVLLNDGRWHACRDFALVAMSGGMKWPNAFTFHETDDMTQERSVTGPMSSVLAIKTKHLQTAEERAEIEAAREAEAAAMFEHQHYCDQATYNDLYQKQQGLCPKCGVLLDNARYVHLYNGELLDRDNLKGCSPLTPRWGNPE